MEAFFELKGPEKDRVQSVGRRFVFVYSSPFIN